MKIKVFFASFFRTKNRIVAQLNGYDENGSKRRLKSDIVFKSCVGGVVELSLALWYKSADRVTGGQVKCASPQIGKALSMHERMNQREAVDEKNYFGITSQIGWKGFKILK